MSYSKLIHDYLDGELAQPDQDMLFTELAHNSDARLEFNQQMKLHMIAQNDMSAIAPPVATTNSIFAQLGFSIPPAGFNGGAASTATGAGIGSALLLFFRKFSNNLITALIGALLTGFILYSLSNLNSGKNPIADMASKEISAPVVSSVEPASDVISRDNTTSNLSQDDVNRMINHAMNKYMTKVDNYYKNYFATLNFENRDKSETKDKTVAKQNSDLSANSIPNNNFQINQNVNPEPIKQVFNSPSNFNNQTQPQVLVQNVENENSMFNLSIRAFSSNPSLNINVPSQSNPWFSNIGLGLSYNVAKQHALGLEIGQEAFPQSFVRDLYGEQLLQQQNPMLVWFGATYRLSLMNLFIPDVLYPYIELLGGMTKIGPIGRSQIGLQFRPDKRVTFNIGAEGTMLWYNVQGKVYDSRKLGLTYGVSIHY